MSARIRGKLCVALMERERKGDMVAGMAARAIKRLESERFYLKKDLRHALEAQRRSEQDEKSGHAEGQEGVERDR